MCGTDKYFEDVNKIIDNLSEEEFYELLIKSGLESCPCEDCDTPNCSENKNKIGYCENRT